MLCIVFQFFMQNIYDKIILLDAALLVQKTCRWVALITRVALYLTVLTLSPPTLHNVKHIQTIRRQ